MPGARQGHDWGPRVLQYNSQYVMISKKLFFHKQPTDNK